MKCIPLLRAVVSVLLLLAGVAVAETPIQPWKQRNPGSLSQLSWLGDRWMAVSESKLIFTSPDGVDWQSAPYGTYGITAVARIGDAFLAPTSSSKTLLSMNGGANWFLRDNPAAAARVFAGNGSLVVGIGNDATGTKVVTTTDGFTWTATETVPSALADGALVWTGDRFVAVGQDKIAWSINGSTWTITTWTGQWLHDVTGQPGGPLLAVGDQGQIARSTDGGATWAASVAPINNNFLEVAGVAGSYVAINGNHKLLHSADGLTWTEVGPLVPRPASYYDVGWNGAYFLAVGDGGAVVKSTDGILWQDHSMGAPTWPLVDVVVGPPGIVAIGRDSLLFSPDSGIGWKRIAAGDGVDWRGIAWCGDRFVSVGGEGQVATSADGLNWTIATVPGVGFGGFYQVAWNGSRAVVTGPQGAVYTSENLMDWTRRSNGIPTYWMGCPVAWTGSRFVAFSANSSDERVLCSASGIDWTASEEPVMQADAIACGGGRIVAVDGGVLALSSDDGETWTVNYPGLPFFSPRELIWDGTRFVAGGFISPWTSHDGVTWTDSKQGTTYQLNGLATTAEGYIGVSAFGYIWTSGSDDRPVASIASITAGEASGAATFTVTLSHATGQDLEIDYATVPGTATEGADYQAASGTVVVPAGQSQATITVPVLDDAFYEFSENFSLSITGVSGGKGAFFESTSPKATISNNDPARLYVDDLTVNEAAGTASVKIRCPDPRQSTLSVFVRTNVAGTGPNHASSPADFTSRSATLSLPPEANETYFDVKVADDYILESNETFEVLLSISSLTLGDESATITIVDGGPGYDGWVRQQQGFNVGILSAYQPTADRDKDGNQNLVSFAMGSPVGQPVAVAAASWRPFLHPPAAVGDRMILETSVPDPLPIGVRWEVQQSTNGQSWTSIASATPTTSWVGNAGIPVVIGEPSAGRRIVTVGSSFTRQDSAAGMMRMKWTLLSP